MLFDGQGRCLRVNRTGLETMRLSENDVKGKELHDLWPEQVRPQADAAVRKVLAGVQCSFDAFSFVGARKHWWVVTIAPIRDADGVVTKFISIATDITERRTAEEQRVAWYEQRLAMEKRYNQEKEQLLMDLHDGVGGVATNISMVAAMGQAAPDGEGMKKALVSISQLSREGIAEIRSFMHSLDRKELNWRSLAAELKLQGAQMVEPLGISFAFNSSISEAHEVPGSLFWINVFKIYKEALTNVIKHANATMLAVDVTVDPAGLRLTIHDNGTGWPDPGEIGRGITNIRKRAADLGGRVSLSNDEGLLVDLTVPLPLEPALPA